MRVTAYRELIDDARRIPVVYRVLGKGILNPRQEILNRIMENARYDEHLLTSELGELINYYEANKDKDLIDSQGEPHDN